MDDACWALTPVASNFAIRGENLPASQASEMRLCYDNKYLYWFFRGEQDVLFERNNEIHGFQKNVAHHDGDVWKDDCALLMLQPEGIDHFYDLWVNAVGTVNDADMSAASDNLWSARDTGFDLDVDFSNQIGEGYWTAEGRISFASLGVSTPQAGDVWKVMLGRVSQKPKENSAWNLLGTGFHDAAAFAELVFLDEPVGVVVTVPADMQLGANKITAVIKSEEDDGRGLYAFVQMDAAGKRNDAWVYGAAAPAGVPVVCQLNVSEEGKATLRYGIVDAVSLSPVIVSPALPRNIKSSVAEVLIDSECPYRLYINGAVVASGAGGAPEKVNTFLQKGVNAFGIELEQGTARVDITAAGQTITPERGWRLAPTDVESFTNPELDTAAWQPAPITADADGHILGRPGALERLRISVLWEETRVYPNSKPTFHIARGADQHLTLVTQGFPGRLLEHFKIHLALPPELDIVGATAYYRATGYQPNYSVAEGGTLEFAGKPYRHYILSADKPLKYEDPVRIMGLMNAFIRYDESVGAPEDRDYPIYFGVEALDGNIVEIMQPLMVRVLPSLDGVQPKALMWQLWGSFFGAMNQVEMKEATIGTMARAGFNNIVAGDVDTSQIGPKHGVANFTTVSFDPWSIDVAAWLEEHPEDALVKMDGTESDAKICSTVLIEKSADYIGEQIQRLLTDRGATWVNWDYEAGVTSGLLSCYCPRCIAGFREYSGLSEDMKLTPEAIQQNYMSEWTDYMNYKMARIARIMSDAVHAYNPDYKYTVYSGYQSADTKWRYGVDWKMVAELEAVDMALCGYGRNFEMLKVTREALGDIPLVTGYLMRPYDRGSTDLLVVPTKATLLRRLFDSTGGILIYDRMPCEGRTYTASAKASQVASAYEDVFLFGEFVAIAGVPEDTGWIGARRLGDTMLVGVMNETSEKKTFTFTLPGNYAKATEFYSGSGVEIGAEQVVELQPGDAVVYALSK